MFDVPSSIMDSRRSCLKVPVLLLWLIPFLPGCDKLRETAKNLEKKAEDTVISETHAPVTQVDGGNYDSFSQQRGRVVVMDFYADWCGPCRALAPMLETIAAESKGMILLGKVNIDQNREFAGTQGVRGVPDVRIFRDGVEVDRFVGGLPDVQLRRRIEVHTKGLAPPKAETATEAKQPSIAPATKDWLPPGIQRR